MNIKKKLLSYLNRYGSYTQEKRVKVRSVRKPKKKYLKLFEKELLKNEFFSKEKSEELDINGIKYKCDVVKYEISEKAD